MRVKLTPSAFLNEKAFNRTMDAQKLEKFRKVLNQSVAELQAAMGAKDSTAAVPLDTSIGRLSRMDAMQAQQMALALKERQRQQLARVDRALRSIEGGAPLMKLK